MTCDRTRLLPILLFFIALPACSNRPSSDMDVQASGAPMAPTNLAAQVTAASSVALSWTAPSQQVTGYYVGKSSDGGNTFTKIATVVSGTAMYTDISVKAGATYQYQVIAYNSAGSSPPSNTISVNVSNGLGIGGTGDDTDNGVPAAPSGLSARVVSNNEIIVQWYPGNSTPVTGYYVQRSTDGGHTFQQAQTTQQGIDDKNVTAGVTYTYRVIAYNGVGTSPASGAIQINASTFSSLAQCQVTVSPPIVSRGQTVAVQFLTSSNTVSAILNGQAVPPTGGVWYVPTQAAGTFYISGFVTNSFGTNGCQATLVVQ